MLVRNCAGGLVFCGNKVFLLRNEKGNGDFPKVSSEKANFQTKSHSTG